MVPNTKSYLSFKAESERLVNLVVLFSHAVPILAQVLSSPEASALVSLKPPDNFPHDKSTGPVLLSWALDYKQSLAHIVILSVFSYFEAYVRGALQDVYDFQGGSEAFVDLSEKRAKRHWGVAPSEVAEAKRKMQTPDDKAKVGKLRKYSEVLADAGFAFPPDLLAVYGARQLAKKLDRRGRNALRAWEIPDLLSNALLLNVSESERSMYDDLRNLRNDVAHGSFPPLTVHSAIKKTTELRTWAARIDEHIGSHFLVLAKYSLDKRAKK
jgi:hypothetical protein